MEAHTGWGRRPVRTRAPKTARSIRSVSIPESVLDNLDLDHEYVFTNSQGGAVRLYSWRSNVWVPSVAKAKAIKDPDTYKPILDQAGAYSRFTAYLRQLATR